MKLTAMEKSGISILTSNCYDTGMKITYTNMVEFHSNQNNSKNTENTRNVIIAILYWFLIVLQEMVYGCFIEGGNGTEYIVHDDDDDDDDDDVGNDDDDNDGQHHNDIHHHRHRQPYHHNRYHLYCHHPISQKPIHSLDESYWSHCRISQDDSYVAERCSKWHVPATIEGKTQPKGLNDVTCRCMIYDFIGWSMQYTGLGDLVTSCLYFVQIHVCISISSALKWDKE